MKNKNYSEDFVFYIDIAKFFQTINRNGIFIEPNCINKIEKNSKIIFQNKITEKKNLSEKINLQMQNIINYNLENRLENFPKIKNLKEKTIYFLGTSSSSCNIISNKDYTYLIIVEGAIPNNKNEFKQIPYDFLKLTGIKYFNALKN